LIASGNESQRRRRRDHSWVAWDNYLTPEPTNSVRDSNRSGNENENGDGTGTGNGNAGGIPTISPAEYTMATSNRTAAYRRSTRHNELERPFQVVRVSSLGQDRRERDPNHPSDPSLTTRGARIQSRTNSSRRVSPIPTRVNSPPPLSNYLAPRVTVEMFSDLSHRTESPSSMSYVSYRDTLDDGATRTPANVRSSNRPPHRRRESQPPPASISLMG